MATIYKIFHKIYKLLKGQAKGLFFYWEDEISS